jgi:hypothetical protein
MAHTSNGKRWARERSSPARGQIISYGRFHYSDVKFKTQNKTKKYSSTIFTTRDRANGMKHKKLFTLSKYKRSSLTSQIERQKN